jgi:UDP-glucose 4-epimerase
MSLNTLLDTLRELTGSDVPARYEAARAGEVRHSQADVSLAERELGYRPTTSVEEGLRPSVDWYRG